MKETPKIMFRAVDVVEDDQPLSHIDFTMKVDSEGDLCLYANKVSLLWIDHADGMVHGFYINKAAQARLAPLEFHDFSIAIGD